ncbi:MULTISPECIES: hypothetical protein [unclassified Streptomyces]|uniref:hypothetical protein n=1 Tax=unclassified Streptomyces TaxID=2593676 RepID=UPI000708A315|nr:MULTISPECIES: hypothetical protein [unclassified Streptomyces]KRD23508.1 hypothetical protein ASE41_11255 [Streptomyces sp. Root264]
MEEERALRPEFCAAMSWLEDVMAADGRGGELHAAVEALRAGTVTVRQVLTRLGIPPHVLTGETGPTRGEGDGGIPVPVPQAIGEVYVCPDGWCGLKEPRPPGGAIPAGGRCWLTNRPLRVLEA